VTHSDTSDLIWKKWDEVSIKTVQLLRRNKRILIINSNFAARLSVTNPHETAFKILPFHLLSWHDIFRSLSSINFCVMFSTWLLFEWTRKSSYQEFRIRNRWEYWAEVRDPWISEERIYRCVYNGRYYFVTRPV